MLRETFPNGTFVVPANREMLARAEMELGLLIPEQLKLLYLESNGFREDKGNAQYLFTLFGDEGLVGFTRFLWREFENVWPGFSLVGYIFFGSSCCDHLFGINSHAPHNLIEFHHNMEGAWEDRGDNIIELYKSDYVRFDNDSEV